jgi:hypothetical protein
LACAIGAVASRAIAACLEVAPFGTKGRRGDSAAQCVVIGGSPHELRQPQIRRETVAAPPDDRSTQFSRLQSAALPKYDAPLHAPQSRGPRERHPAARRPRKGGHSWRDLGDGPRLPSKH